MSGLLPFFFALVAIGVLLVLVICNILWRAARPKTRSALNLTGSFVILAMAVVAAGLVVYGRYQRQQRYDNLVRDAASAIELATVPASEIMGPEHVLHGCGSVYYRPADGAVWGDNHQVAAFDAIAQDAKAFEDSGWRVERKLGSAQNQWRFSAERDGIWVRRLIDEYSVRPLICSRPNSRPGVVVESFPDRHRLNESSAAAALELLQRAGVPLDTPDRSPGRDWVRERGDSGERCQTIEYSWEAYLAPSLGELEQRLNGDGWLIDVVSPDMLQLDDGEVVAEITQAVESPTDRRLEVSILPVSCRG